MIFVSHSEEETENFGKELVKKLIPGSIVGLKGTLGAGKSVIARGIARGLGITEPITSPTYTIQTTYEGKYKLFHMDLYRITAVEEFEMLGAEDQMDSGGITVIEWFEHCKDAIPERMIEISVEIEENLDRKIIVKEK